MNEIITFAQAIALEVRIARISHNYMQKEIALFLGVSQAMYSRKERGTNDFTFDEVLAICKFLDIEFKRIIRFAEQRYNEQ